MLFRQLFDKSSSTYTYLIASAKGREALIIDPVLENVERYIQLLKELNLKLVKVIDTHIHADHISGITELRDQTIHPYTDLLLHDMGEGLADNFSEAKANGQEWRTPPLWGIGLTPVVNGHSLYLHDGRARNLLEAVLWHGGEAKASKNKVVLMEPNERKQLLQFIESL